MSSDLLVKRQTQYNIRYIYAKHRLETLFSFGTIKTNGSVEDNRWWGWNMTTPQVYYVLSRSHKRFVNIVQGSTLYIPQQVYNNVSKCALNKYDITLKNKAENRLYDLDT